MAAFRAFMFLAALAIAPPVLAQDAVAPDQTIQLIPQILTIDSDALYRETAFGKKLEADWLVEASVFSGENTEIVAQFSAEEDALTQNRATMDPQEFREAAAAFDVRVQKIRAERDAGEEALRQRRVGLRGTFMERIRPIVGEIMFERGALAVMEGANIFAARSSIDITQEAIARIDAKIGDGTVVDATPDAPEQTDDTAQ